MFYTCKKCGKEVEVETPKIVKCGKCKIQMVIHKKAKYIPEQKEILVDNAFSSITKDKEGNLFLHIKD